MEAGTETDFQVIYFLRGIPGSGKSTYSASLISFYKNFGIELQHLENDQFFVDENGVYTFDASRHHEARAYVFSRFTDTYMNGGSLVIANVFANVESLTAFAQVIADNPRPNVHVKVVDLNGDFGSIHDVPEEQMEVFRKHFKRSTRYVHRIHDLFKSCTVEVLELRNNIKVPGVMPPAMLI